MNKMENKNLLNWDCIPGFDVGGAMRLWLFIQTDNIPDGNDIRKCDRVYAHDDVYFIRHLWSCSWDESEIPNNLKDNKKLLDFFINDPRNVDGKFYCEIYDKKFLHYRAGGNWKNEGMGFHKELSQQLKAVLC
jgi:hypothetical protein